MISNLTVSQLALIFSWQCCPLTKNRSDLTPLFNHQLTTAIHQPPSLPSPTSVPPISMVRFVTTMPTVRVMKLWSPAFIILMCAVLPRIQAGFALEDSGDQFSNNLFSD